MEVSNAVLNFSACSVPGRGVSVGISLRYLSIALPRLSMS